jgi:Na+-transporting methylmalonyl-CoA/oxaloacetate decarboxylase gamma subunit
VPSVIVAAAALLLLGLALFVAGVLTGLTVLYWLCVAVCAVSAVMIALARRRISAPARGDGKADPASPTAAADALPADALPADAAEPAAAATSEGGAGPEELPDPPVEDVEVTDLLLVVDLKDEVLVLDEHPRYHLEGCVHLRGRTPIPLPVQEARTDGFTPCGVCEPDRNLAARARARRAPRGG